MKRLIVRFALVFAVLFLTFPVPGAYSFAQSWDASSIASRVLSLVSYFPYAGTAVNGGLVWYCGMAGILTLCFCLGDLFLHRVKIEAGSVLDPGKWKTPGATKPFALVSLLFTGAFFLWALLVVAILYMESRHELALYGGGKLFMYPAGALTRNFGWLESAGWGALMLFATWPIGSWITRRWNKQ